MLRERIVKWLFPSSPEQVIKKLTRKPGKLSVWNSLDEQLGREEVERERQKSRENELPHPID